MRRRMVLAAVCLLLLGSLGERWSQAVGSTAGQGSDPAWSNPTARTLKLVGPWPSEQRAPNFLSNLDCEVIDYRLTTGTTMQEGCFSASAFGLVDLGSGIALIGGTDEGLPILPYSPHQFLAPWPGTVDTLAVSTANTGGSYLALYQNITGDFEDVRDQLGRLVAKQVDGPPDLSFTDRNGQPLVINAGTLAFSDNGSWLVAETLGGSFVRINLATLDMTAFAPAFASQGSPALLKSQVAVSNNGRYVAISNWVATSFKVYDLNTCSGQVINVQPLNCANNDYWPFINSQVTGLSNLTHVRFINNGILGFDASGADGINSYELAPTSGISSLIDYLALGDSYTSGEGAFDYLTGTDSVDNVCHQSARSYPLLIADQLFDSGHSAACSGAKIHDVIPDKPSSYPGQVRGGTRRDQRPADSVAQILADFSPGYLSQAEFVAQYQPGVITVSVGGDDIGFGDMLQACVEPHISLHLSDSTCFDTYEDRLEIKNLIDQTVPKWTSLYHKLQAKSPGSRLYAIGYPQIAVDNGNCGLNVHLSKSELEFSEEVISYLNGAIQEAAGQANVGYIDIGQALSGHRLCESKGYDVAVNGLTAGTDGGPFDLKIFGKESYHPNQLGQALIAAYILKQSHNLTSGPNPAASGTNDSQNLLNAPKSGRKVNKRIPTSDATSKTVKKKVATAVKVDGSSNHLRPGTGYTVRLDGADGTTVGQVTSGADGSIDGSFTLPDSTTTGGHTIDITGVDETDDSVDITQPIYVPASPDDADGDGIPDDGDSCPGAVNSGTNADHDGIDDVCDPVIGNAPTSGTGSGSGQSNNNTQTNNTQGPGNLPADVVANFGQDTEPPASISLMANITDTAAPGPDSNPVPVGNSATVGSFVTNPGNSSKTAKSTLSFSHSVASIAPPLPASRHFSGLPRINWLPWVLIFVIGLLLLLLLAWLLGRSLDKPRYERRMNT